MSQRESRAHCPECNRDRLVRQNVTNHALHLLICLFCCGVWLPVWLFFCLAGDPWRCTKCGAETGRSVSKGWIVLAGFGAVAAVIISLLAIAATGKLAPTAREEAEAKEAERLAVEEKAKRKSAERAALEKKRTEEAKRASAAQLASKQQKMRSTVNQTVMVLDRDNPERAEPNSEWPDASKFAVQQDNLRVRAVHFEVGPNELQIKLLLENTGAAGQIDFHGWGDQGSKHLAELKDNFAKSFRVKSEEKTGAIIQAGQSISDALTFEVSLANASYLNLELPAPAFAGVGVLHLRIPKSMIVFNVAVAMGAKAVPDLCELLRDASPRNRVQAAALLGKIGTAAKLGIQALTDALNDKDAAVRKAAVEALASMGPTARAAYVPVLKALGDPDMGVTTAVIACLARIGPPAKEDLERLKAALDDRRNASIRYHATVAVADLGADAKPALDSLVKNLEDSDPQVRVASAQTLGRIGPGAKNAVPALTQALKEPQREMRLSAVRSLAQIGVEAGAAVPIVEALQDKDDQVFQAAFDSLKAMKRLRASEIPALIGALKFDRSESRLFATGSLAVLGSEAKEAVPALTASLSDRDKGVRQGAAIALGSIGPPAWRSVPDLIKLLDEKDGAIRKSVFGALGAIGPDAKTAAPRLIQFFEEAAFLGPASDVLVMIGKGAVPALIDATDKKNKRAIRLAAIAVLGRMKFEARDALPTLTDLAATDDWPRLKKDAQAAKDKILGR